MTQGGRIVIVTGAAAGIGLASAVAFAEVGDRVILVDRDGEAARGAAARMGGAAVALPVDVSDEGGVRQAVAAAARDHGRIDVLISNAGVVDPAAHSVLDLPLDVLDRLISVNVEGSFLVSREVARIMAAQAGGGAIVHLASGAALRALPNRAAYSMTKAAILGLVRATACEWASAGITVNAVLPGYTATEILLALEAQGRFNRTRAAAAVPLGRLADPADIAAAILHVAGARYMTGASLVVDGGVDAFGGAGAASAAPAPIAPDAGPAIVTGGASGIGAAIAKRLAADGREVVILDREPTPGGIALDIADHAAVGQAVTEIAARHGPPAILVNNAGVADAFAPTVTQERADFRRVFDVNATAALLTARAVAPHMVAAGGGTIVNLSSIAASGGLPTRNAYCAAKAGVTMLTRSLACEWAAHGIRVNAVAPGYIATPGVAALERAGKRDLSAIRRRIPLGRLGTPEEIAATVAWLASPASAYVTGSVWHVDGGWTAYGDAGPASDIR